MHLLTVAEAQKKLCPLSRGVYTTGDSAGNTRIVGGVNIMPNGSMMACQGSNCALWQHFGVKEERTEIPCTKHMRGGEECELEHCTVCDGTGKRILREPFGACGLNQLGSAMELQKIGKLLELLIPGQKQ